MALSISDICILFARKGDRAYDGEGVTQLEHALQTANLAQQSGATAALVTAALLHDLGHLLNDQGDTPTLHGVDDVHQYAALPFLRPLFDDDVLAPIKLHVDAKRYLCATQTHYFEALSADSKRSLALQGGPFTSALAAAFIAEPHAQDAVRVRRWDDLAKVAGAATPPLAHFVLAVEVAQRPVAATR
ncbi:MAG: phosphonate degradation HD-domain oxygenase [Casimicrobiaceae bacterium]